MFRLNIRHCGWHWLVLLSLVIWGTFVFLHVKCICKENTCYCPHMREENEAAIRMRGPLSSDDSRLISHIRKELYRPSPLPYNLSTEGSYQLYKSYLSFPFIKKSLEKLFLQSKSKGFFVEAGALDGEYLSNSLWLEQKLGWTGLLVEPGEKNFRDMVHKNRKAWLLKACLSSDKFPKEVVMISLVRLKDTHSNPSVMVRGSSFEKGFGMSNTTVYKDFEKYTERYYYTRQCYPLHSILVALNVSVVDFLSLDVQGSELQIFKTIPLEKVYIRSLVCEDAPEPLNYGLIEYFNSVGFVLFAASPNGPDYFFINKNDSILMNKATAGLAQNIIDRSNRSLEFPALPYGYSYEEVVLLHDLIRETNKVLRRVKTKRRTTS